jgi:hypothetical protein
VTGVTASNGTAETPPTGSASPATGAEAAVPPGSAAGAVFEYDSFEIVEQLRGVNAIHLLQLVGQHLSRVGLDFVSTPGS